MHTDKELPFTVDLPHDAATEDAVFAVKEFAVQFSKGTYRRKAHLTRRMIVRPAIREWLKHSIRKGDFSIGHASRDPVSFHFKTKEAAALFKLFWHP